MTLFFSGKVAFHAYLDNSDGEIKKDDVLKFTKVFVNDGQGYNPSTGIFKAPYPGVYKFTAHVCGIEKEEVEDVKYGVSKNGKQVSLSSANNGIHTI